MISLRSTTSQSKNVFHLREREKIFFLTETYTRAQPISAQFHPFSQRRRRVKERILQLEGEVSSQIIKFFMSVMGVERKRVFL